MSPSNWNTPTTRQVWVSLPSSFIKIAGGMSYGFSSCFLTAIREPDSDVKMDIHTATWFVSSMGMGSMISYFIASYIMTRYGRRMAMICCSLPGIIGQLLMYFAKDTWTLITARFLSGITMGGVALLVVVIIGEYTCPKNRGSFLNMTTAFLNVGGLMAHAAGHYISWRTLAVIISVPLVLCLIVSYTSPESPSWLAERKQYEKSREAFYWLRGRTEDSTREIEELIRAQRHKTVDRTFIEDVQEFFLKFKKKNFVNPLIVIFFAIFLMESSGRHIFPSYASILIEEMMPGGFNMYIYNIILDVLITLSGLVTAYMVRIMKTRTLLFSTGAATAAVLALACLSLYLVKSGFIPEDYSTIPMILFALFYIVSNTGCNCIPLALLGEIFPLEHRAVSSLIACGLSASILTFYLKLLPYMIAAMYIYGAFAILCVTIIVMLVVLYFILPETKDRTLQEIEDYFTHGHFREKVSAPNDDETEAFTVDVTTEK